MSDRETIEVYNARAAQYVTLVDKLEGAKPSLTAFMDRLRPGAFVLDMGCGPGTDSAHMAARGLRPDPVDPSDAMIEIARTRFDLPARLGTFDDLQGPYDAVWASFSLLHMARADLPDYLHRLSQEMTPGGLLHLGLKSGTGEERDSIGRKYSYFSADEIATWLSEAGFTPEEPRFGQERGLAGTIDAFFTLSAVRNAD